MADKNTNQGVGREIPEVVRLPDAPDNSKPPSEGDLPTPEMAGQVKKSDSRQYGLLSTVKEMEKEHQGELGEDGPERQNTPSHPNDPDFIRANLESLTGGGEDAQESPPEGEKGQKSTEEQPEDGKKTPEIEGYEPIENEDDLVGTSDIGGKFKRLKERHKANEKALLAKIEAQEAALEAAKAASSSAEDRNALSAAGAEPEIPKETLDELTKLRETVQEQAQTIERVRLEESPRFKAEYTDKIKELGNKCFTHIRGIGDKAEVQKVWDRLSSAVSNIPPGDEFEDDYYMEVNKIIQAVPDHQRAPLYAKLVEIRDKVTEREAALNDWKETTKKFESTNSEVAAKAAQTASYDFDLASSAFQEENANLLGAFRAEGARELFKYDDTVAPEVELAKQSVAESARLGKPTRDLVKMAVLGAQTPFLSGVAARLLRAVYENNQKINDLQKQLEEANRNPASGGKHKGSQEVARSQPSEEDNPDGRYAMLGAVRRQREAAGA